MKHLGNLGFKPRHHKKNYQRGVEMKIIKTTFIIQLPSEIQSKIKQEVVTALTAVNQFSKEALDDAMDGRLSDIEDVINIKPYL
jgi:hypothetical protein